MVLNRSSASSMALGLVALSGVATAAQAKGRNLFVWNGTVDREVVFTIQGRDVDVRGDANSNGRIRMNEVLPRTAGTLYVQREDGRGDVDILEQPSRSNGYVARVRIRDPRSGADRYKLVVGWNDSNDGGWNGRDDDDRRARDRDHDWDRGRGNDNRGRGNDDRGRGDGPWNNGNRDAGGLSWGGYIDDVGEIRIRGRDVDYFTRSGAPIRSTHADILGSALPRRDAYVTLEGVSGRGSVQVVQQPNARNGFTAIIRIDDPRGGYGAYGFNVKW